MDSSSRIGGHVTDILVHFTVSLFVLFFGKRKKLLKTKIKLLYTTATASLIRRKLITLEVRNYNKINSHQSLFGLDIIRYNGRNMVPV